MLSFLAAALSFGFIEKPARAFLNRKENMSLAFLSMSCAVAFCLALGITVRKNNYINAEPKDVARGGLVFNPGNYKRKVMLVGDSNGSMYGKVLKEICDSLDYKLIVASVSARDPLPSTKDDQSGLWLDSLNIVRKEKPDFLILACSWADKLKKNKERLAFAVESLKPLVGRLERVRKRGVASHKGIR